MKSKALIFGLGCFIFFGIAFTAYGQNKTVSGTVKDASTEKPLPGVNILLMGTTTGTATDIDGKYKITVPSLQDTLRFSFIGYATQKISINGQTHIDIALQSKVISGKNLVVVGYGNQKKISVTGSVSELKSPTQKLEKIPSPSLTNMLAGQIPGIITRQSSGEPGYDQAQIFIRGLSTFGNNSPLILVDGVQRSMDNIDPEAIQSFTILKDASATAVYGARGANGVILIKTKRGHAGKPQVTFRTDVGRLTALRMPDYIGGVKYAELVNEANTNVGLSPVYSASQIQKIKDQSEPYLYPNVDWTDLILKPHTFQSLNHLSVSGGSSNMQYYVNLGFTRKGGIYRHDNLKDYRANDLIKKYNFRTNINANLSQDLSVFVGVAGIIQDGHYPGTGAPAIFNSLKITTPIEYPPTNPDGSIAGGPSYKGNNPWGLVTQSGYSDQVRHTEESTLKAKWDLSSLVTKGLSINAKLAYDIYNISGINHYITFGLKQYEGKDANGNDKYNVVRQGQPIGYQPWTTSNTRQLYLQGSLRYKRTFLGKHEIGGMLLFNQRNYFQQSAANAIDALPYRNRGLSGRATYSYEDRYLAEFDFGYTGSENFAPGKRYGFFPSISAGWVISNEKFFNVPFVSLFKLRGSWGEVGNDQIGGRRFLYLGSVSKNTNKYWFGKSQQEFDGDDEGQIGNPDVTWETAIKRDIGLNIQFLEDKVSLQVDAFSQLRENILMQRNAIPLTTGYFPWVIPYANVGRVRDKGLDGRLKIQNTSSGGFYYSFRGNFTFAHNTILRSNQPPHQYSYQDNVGHPLDAPYGLRVIGFFKNQQDIDQSPKQEFVSTLYPGDIKYEDVNGDGVVNGFDRVFLNGYPRTPEITFGFGGAVAWKGFQFSVFFTGAARTSLFLSGPSIYPFQRGPNTYNIRKVYYNNRWTPETKKAAEFPAVTPGDNKNNFRRSSVYLRNAGFLRLQSAGIAYTLPVKISQKLGMSSLKFFINGSKLLTFDHIKFEDPAAGVLSQYDNDPNDGTAGYPLQRGVDVGLQIKFQ
jgi:TonB-linked SusC/RagA family outer membrane protein